MKKLDDLQFVGNFDDIDYYLFKPSLFKLYPDCYEAGMEPDYVSRPVHKIRMLLEHLKTHYEIYYMIKDSEVIGHIVVARGGWRISCSKKEDIVLCPIWISPAHRGKGFGTKGISVVLNELNISYEKAYEYIGKDNIASIRSVEKNGYKMTGTASERGLFRTIVYDDKGTLNIYCFVPEKR